MLKIKEINQICAMVKACCGKQINTVDDITKDDIVQSINRIKKRRASKDAEQLIFLNEALEQIQSTGTLITQENKDAYKKRLIIAAHTSEEELDKKKKLYRYIFTEDEIEKVLAEGGGNSGDGPAACAQEFYKYLSPFAGSRNADVLRNMLRELNNTSYDAHIQSLRARDRQAAESRRSMGVGADDEQTIREGWSQIVTMFQNEPAAMFPKLIQTAEYPEVCAVISPDMKISPDDYHLAIQALAEDLQDSDPSVTQDTAEQILRCAAEVFGTVLPKNTDVQANTETPTPDAIAAYFANKFNGTLNTIEKRINAFDEASKAVNICTMDDYLAVRKEYSEIFALLKRANNELGEHDEPAFDRPAQRFKTLTAHLQIILKREEDVKNETLKYLNNIQANYDRAKNYYRIIETNCVTLESLDKFGEEQTKAYKRANECVNNLRELNDALYKSIIELEKMGIPFTASEKYFSQVVTLHETFETFKHEDVLLGQWLDKKREYEYKKNSTVGNRMMACCGAFARLIIGEVLIYIEYKNPMTYFYNRSILMYEFAAMAIGIVCYLYGCYFAGKKMGVNAHLLVMKVAYLASIIAYWITFLTGSLKWQAAPTTVVIFCGILLLLLDGMAALLVASKLSEKFFSLGWDKTETMYLRDSKPKSKEK